MSIREYITLCDPIGSMLYVCSSTLLLMALDWAGGAYAWSSLHVAIPLSLGLALLIAFGLYGMLSVSHMRRQIVSDGYNVQSGKVGTMDLWLTSSSRETTTSLFQSSLTRLKGTSSATSVALITNIRVRWIYFSGVNTIVNQVVLNLGFENNAWIISIRQLSYLGPIMVLPLLIA